MSTLKVNNLQVGQDATATNNFTLYQPAVPDGTVRLGVGNSGSVSDILTLKSSSLGIGTDNPTNAALHVEGRNFSFGGPGNNFSGEGNLYIGNYNNPLLDSWDRNIRIASKNQIQIELYTDWDGTQYSDSILFSSPDGLGLQFNGNKGGVNRSGIFPLNYNAGTAITDDYLFFQAGNKYLWFDADTGRLGINRSSGSGWTDTLDVNGTSRVTGIAKFDSNVGIGTVSPSSILHTASEYTTSWPISGGTTDYLPRPHELLIQNTATNTTNSFAGLYFIAGQDSPGSGINSARIGAVRESNNTYQCNLVFSTRGPANSHTEKMRIKHDGNVGIGTNNPTEKLDVRGGDISFDNKLYTDTTSGNTGDTRTLTLPNISEGASYIFTLTRSSSLGNVNVYQALIIFNGNGNYQSTSDIVNSAPSNLTITVNNASGGTATITLVNGGVQRFKATVLRVN